MRVVFELCIQSAGLMLRTAGEHASRLQTIFNSTRMICVYACELSLHISRLCGAGMFRRRTEFLSVSAPTGQSYVNIHMFYTSTYVAIRTRARRGSCEACACRCVCDVCVAECAVRCGCLLKFMVNERARSRQAHCIVYDAICSATGGHVDCVLYLHVYVSGFVHSSHAKYDI